jgi:hypothetical protein
MRPSPPRNFPAPPEPMRGSVAADAEWVGVFERFDGRVERVGHVGLHAGDAVEAGARAHAAGGGFVVGEGLAGARVDTPPMVRLLMVPALAAGTRDGMAWASARSRTSTMRCEVSTLPPATGRGEGVDDAALGRDEVSGRRMPAVAGASSGAGSAGRRSRRRA